MATVVEATVVHAAATPEQVWDVLADLSAHRVWTPQLRLRAPAVVVGGRCTVLVGLLPGPATPLPCRFTRVERGVALAWGTGLGTFGSLVHEFELEPVGSGSRIRHRETFAGVAGPPVALLRGWLTGEYTAMSERLAARAEALHA